MAESFSTDVVPVAERLEAWLNHAQLICGDCRFHFPKHGSFQGSIIRRTVGGAALTRFSSSQVSFVKFPAITGSSNVRDCIVITQLEGTRRYCQSGAIATLAPGDTTLVDASFPWTSDCAGNCARLYCECRDGSFKSDSSPRRCQYCRESQENRDWVPLFLIWRILSTK